MCDIAGADDARTAYAGSYSAWLTKVKADDAKAKWFSNHTRRLFTIDFEAQLFYYSNGAVMGGGISFQIGTRNTFGHVGGHLAKMPGNDFENCLSDFLTH